MTKKEFLSGTYFIDPNGFKYRLMPRDMPNDYMIGHLEDRDGEFHCIIEKVTDQTIYAYRTILSRCAQIEIPLSTLVLLKKKKMASKTCNICQLSKDRENDFPKFTKHRRGIWYQLAGPYCVPCMKLYNRLKYINRNEKTDICFIDIARRMQSGLQ